jgi:deoxycytidine triphosphate deaminase
MTILANAKLKEAISSGEIQIAPAPQKIEPASIDLTVGDEVFMASRDEVIKLSEGDFVLLPAGEIALIVTREEIKLSPKIAGHLGLRSFFTRKGLILLAGPQIDPGFEGTLHVVLCNIFSTEISLTYGEPFCTVEFHELSESVDTPYEGTYQSQKGITPQEIVDIHRRHGYALSIVTKNIQAMTQDISVLIEEIIQTKDSVTKLRNRTDKYMMIFIFILVVLVMGIIATVFVLL